MTQKPRLREAMAIENFALSFLVDKAKRESKWFNQSDAGSLSLVTSDILGWMTLCCRGLSCVLWDV